jgi:YD repeat-containing protein
VTTTHYDDRGREIEYHALAKKGFLSSIAVDNRTTFSYDEHGNQTEMITNDADGTLISRTTSVFVYDSHGNWIKKTETALNNTWKTEPFPVTLEIVREFRRTITYFPDK